MIFLKKLFLWSWLITLPVTLVGGYVLVRTLERTYTFHVRYGGWTKDLELGSVARYEVGQLANMIRAKFKNNVRPIDTQLNQIYLVVPTSNLALLESHMPQSGFNYVEGRMLQDNKWQKMKIRYRGDSSYRWAWDKKSIRIKTGKSSLHDGQRLINFLAPRSNEQLNNYFSYLLANQMGLLAPRVNLVRLFLNGEDRGIHTQVEQISELSLRNGAFMPGDIYRGELLGMGLFLGSGIPSESLFTTAGVWDKVAVNNHYPSDSQRPIERLVELVRNHRYGDVQEELSQIMDMNAWGRFSAFEYLAQTEHTDETHNWRIYFDPWRNKFVPIVWDPMGWYAPLRRKALIVETIPNSLMAALFLNGDFLRARASALNDFFVSGQDKIFLDAVSNTVEILRQEIDTDPYLNPPDPNLVDRTARKLEYVIQKIMLNAKAQHLGKDPESNAVLRGPISPSYLNVSIGGRQALKNFRLRLNKSISESPKVSAVFQTSGREQRVALAAGLSDDQMNIEVEGIFLPDLRLKMDKNHRGVIYQRPGVYRVEWESDELIEVISLDYLIDDEWKSAPEAESIELIPFNISAPVRSSQPLAPIVWTGTVSIVGHEKISQPLIIEPGTTVELADGANLLITAGLSAKGSSEQPIRFIPAKDNQEPWGAIVLQGSGSNGSVLEHCEIRDGSGSKSDLFEYSGMLSIHDVQRVSISHCRLQDNHTVDDMVHAVYSEISFHDVHFKNALSDGLDLDISSAQISDSSFINSGNDGVDLMTTRAVITNSQFIRNGDKGISVGESSQLHAANNLLANNTIGIQSKDGSRVFLSNETFRDNAIGLHAYKKNWQYGSGGKIFITKSAILNSKTTADAQKHSSIQIFDSFIEDTPKAKRVQFLQTDMASLAAARPSTLWPDPVDTDLAKLLEYSPGLFQQYIDPTERGRHLHE